MRPITALLIVDLGSGCYYTYDYEECEQQLLACLSKRDGYRLGRIVNMGSDLLFSMPSFLSGAARTLDLGGTYTQYNVSTTPKAADSLAMMHDLAVVGKDCGKEVILDEQTKKALAKKLAKK